MPLLILPLINNCVFSFSNYLGSFQVINLHANEYKTHRYVRVNNVERNYKLKALWRSPINERTHLLFKRSLKVRRFTQRPFFTT